MTERIDSKDGSASNMPVASSWSGSSTSPSGIPRSATRYRTTRPLRWRVEDA